MILLPAQVTLLIEVLDFEARTLLLLAVLTGLRRGELSALEWDDIDERGIDVRRTGSPEGGVGNPKTKKSRRLVEIGPVVRKVLAEWKATLPADAPNVFSYRRNPYTYIYRALANRILPVCKALGLPQIGWHTLRHTCNSWGRFAGNPPEVMKRQMGHAKVDLTLNLYSHVDQMTVTAEAASKIEALLTVPEPGTLETEVVQ